MKSFHAFGVLGFWGASLILLVSMPVIFLRIVVGSVHIHDWIQSIMCLSDENTTFHQKACE